MARLQILNRDIKKFLPIFKFVKDVNISYLYSIILNFVTEFLW